MRGNDTIRSGGISFFYASMQAASALVNSATVLFAEVAGIDTAPGLEGPCEVIDFAVPDQKGDLRNRIVTFGESAHSNVASHFILYFAVVGVFLL